MLRWVIIRVVVGFVFSSVVNGLFLLWSWNLSYSPGARPSLLDLIPLFLFCWVAGAMLCDEADGMKFRGLG